jgi:hypothetical protein
MRGYAEIEVFDPSDIELLRRATSYVDRMPGKIDDRYVRCHELTRALAHLLSGVILVWQPGTIDVERLSHVIVVDGHYGSIEHSWLVTPKRRILDPYVPGALPQVQLVDPYVPRNTYREMGLARADIRKDVIERLISEAA